MKNLYESVIIFRGDLTEEQYKYKVNKYLDTISSLSTDTKITKIDRIGERKLAYEIKSHKTGWYLLVQFKTEAENIRELERLFRIDDDIMKFITLKMDEDEIEDEDEITEESEDKIIVESEQKEIDYWDMAFGLIDDTDINNK